MKPFSYERFEMRLRDTGQTAYKVSKATGIATSTLTAWKKGEYVPKLDKLSKIADYLGVTVEYFMQDAILEGTPPSAHVTRLATKQESPKLDIKDAKVLFYGDYELTDKEKKIVEGVIKGVIESRNDERQKNK